MSYSRVMVLTLLLVAMLGMGSGMVVLLPLATRRPVVNNCLAPMLLLVKFEPYDASRSTVWFFLTKLPSGLHERARLQKTS